MPRDLQAVEDDVRNAFDNAQVGDVLTICRWNCRACQSCLMCAHVMVRHDMTVEDVLQIATAHRA